MDPDFFLGFSPPPTTHTHPITHIPPTPTFNYPRFKKVNNNLYIQLTTSYVIDKKHRKKERTKERNERRKEERNKERKKERKKVRKKERKKVRKKEKKK